MIGIKHSYGLTAIFAVIALVLATGLTLFIVLAVKPQKNALPEFSYQEEPDDYGADSVYSDDELNELTAFRTSNDPLHYADIDIDGFALTVSGVSAGANVTQIYLSEPYTPAQLFYDEGYSFSAGLRCDTEFRGYTALYIKLANGLLLDYRLKLTDKGFEIPDLSEVQEHSALVTANPIDLPQSGVADYISVSEDPLVHRSVLSQVKAISDRVCSGLSNDYDKLRALAEWVSENIYYDYEARNNGVSEKTLTLEYVISEHRSVCGGFANLFSALCAAQGILCYNVSGTVVTGGICYEEPYDKESLHEWNVAVIDGRQIIVDTVWNTSNRYTAEDGYKKGKRHTQYFDMTEELFAFDHKAKKSDYRDYFA